MVVVSEEVKTAILSAKEPGNGTPNQAKTDKTDGFDFFHEKLPRFPVSLKFLP